MPPQIQATQQPIHHRRLGLGPATLAALLAAGAAVSQTQTQQNQQTQQNVTPPAQTQRPAVTTPPARVTTPAPATNANQTRNLLNNLFAPSSGTNNAATGRSTTTTPATNPTATAIQRRALTNGVQPANNPTNAPGLHVASLNTNQATAGRAIQSRAFLGHPGPPGSTEKETRNGSIVRTAADGSVIDVRSPRNGMYIQHGVDGSRRIIVEQPDRSRIYASSRGIQYVQHPYMFRGRAYDHRTFYVQGKTSHQVYRPYNYGGTTLDVYAPTRLYEPAMYQWATSRFNAPQPFSWGYTNGATPWYGYYKGYFTPDSSYSSPSSWLTDFVLASSLMSSYASAPPTAQSSPANAAPVTPEVKQKLAQEVDRQVRQESVEAQATAQNRDVSPGAGSVVQELSDRQPHVLVVASDLDLVDPSGRRCMISEGDVVQVTSPPQPSSGTAQAVILSSKGGVECERAAQVEIAVADLQEMQNHMRETIDQGLASTNAAKQAKSVTPAYAEAAPPPDPNAARELAQQQQIAAAAEG
ncbi:MAG TPA: hypothetical protein VGP32_03005 [Steroidobacteraceae bacterium]|jgi:hypothetical protein|nr:hypothetical protein [Steroidobacteraceae bacterium]